ncbi:MAG: aminopeptidase [Deltaproteobacteria bacterium]|nr:aminopeptidase [Deltaproteobacteria bacterium]
MSKLTKKQLKDLQEKLTVKSVSVWEKANTKQRQEIMALGERYKDFLSWAKTERLAVEFIRRRAQEEGFQELAPGIKADRVFACYRNKMIAVAVRGRRPLSEGLHLIGSHIDAPRLDLKMHPLYEDQDLAFLKTHYYGGIKKYQWFARPLALCGVVCTADGRSVAVNIGDDPEDPVFTVLDLLPHLSRKSQESKKLSEAFEAERMNLLIGGLPLDSDEKGEKVKLSVLQHLYEHYGFSEADLISAELEAVPAGPARDVGLDRALVGGYGQDDRASSYALMEAILGVEPPEAPALALFVDKEEIGSDGATSARGRFLEFLVADLLDAWGEEANYLRVMRCLASSRCLSADANAAFDPDYPEVHEKRNAAFLGRGVSLTKYTGSGGKYAANDADAEYVAWLRKVWDQAGVVWQAAGMGKVDEGGGGTIAKHLAVYGMDVVDVGPPLLSMHSPFEICAKADLYSSREAYRAFFQAPPA